MKMLSTQALMLIYMCVGYYCNKKNIIDKPTEIKLTDFVLSITMPCMVFNSFNMKLTVEFVKEASFCLAISFAICGMGWLLGKFIYNRYPNEKKSILQYATLVNNCGFLGLPIISSVLGEEGLVLAAIFIIPNRIFMWTAGISIFSNSTDKKQAFLKVLMNPCMVAVYLGLLQAAVQLPIPEFVQKALTGIGNCTTPISMLLIGSMLTALTLDSFKDWSTIYYGFIRLALLPIIAMVFMKVLGADDTLTACGVILTAMPAGSTTALLAQKYGADAVYGTKIVLTSVLFSMISIPFITLLV
ncbi:MAG: AEC family transporter [Lachnospiraceae bacterium]|nr:AEC family transporter [Lachnospiraceae bacterium]